MGSELVIKANDATFDNAIARDLVFVDFYAEWCGPCRMLTPILDALAEEMKGKVTFVKVDTEEAPHVAERFEITSIPTLILFKNGQLVTRIVGLRTVDEIRSIILRAG